MESLRPAPANRCVSCLAAIPLCPFRTTKSDSTSTCCFPGRQWLSPRMWCFLGSQKFGQHLTSFQRHFGSARLFSLPTKRFYTLSKPPRCALNRENSVERRKDSNRSLTTSVRRTCGGPTRALDFSFPIIHGARE